MENTTEILQAPEKILSDELLYQIDAYWRAANYLSVGQLYLRDNPLLKEPLQLKHIKICYWATGAPPPGRISSIPI